LLPAVSKFVPGGHPDRKELLAIIFSYEQYSLNKILLISLHDMLCNDAGEPVLDEDVSLQEGPKLLLGLLSFHLVDLPSHHVALDVV
jgi:hypothetical protein